tara:strand:+ start:161 stop:2482 length:2322 start_codon:yes stop_codon:yes gene_type:complete
MCGIIGGNLFTNKRYIEIAQELIQHRGRDAHDVVSINGFWLGHNRLSIQNVGNDANQPMWDDTRRYCITFNGELWKKSFDALNDKLREQYNFRTMRSDTELLLYAYRHYEDKMFEHLDGMYSFAIYDSWNKKIVLGRDWVGRLPFYYLHKYGGLAFASEKKSLSETFVDCTKDIKIVQPSHFYEYDLITGELKPTKYYDVEKEIPPSDTSLEEVTRKIFTKLEDAVENELIADVPVCTILSGGIDSVLITYFLKQKIPDIKAYVVNVGNSTGKDDIHFARMAAKWLDIPLIEVKVSKSQINKALKESVWAAEMDSWTQITPAVAQLFLAKQIHDDGYKVVFGGEGADELFGSYGNIQKMYYKQDTNKKARLGLIKNLHKNNLIRTNKAMMYGGTVELRTPFLDKEFARYALSVVTIDAKHHKHPNGFVDIDWQNKGHMKFPLRKAFEFLGMPEELLWRKKETFQVGCHTDYLREEKEKITRFYNKLFHLPVKKTKVQKVMSSNIMLKDKVDLKDADKHLSDEVYVVGAMEKPKCNLDDIEIMSTKFSKVGKTTLEKYKNLKVVITRGHGNDYVDGALCEKKGVQVIRMNQYTDSCAEWIVDKVEKDSVVAVWGAGGIIGKAVCGLLSKMDINWYAVGSNNNTFFSCENVDVVISCIPYDKKTYKHNANFFNKDFFSQFKKPVDFISISRGPTHNNEDLLELLSIEKLANVHIDTVDSDLRDKLLEHKNFHYYEHQAWDYKPISPQENFRLLQLALDESKEMIYDKLRNPDRTI